MRRMQSTAQTLTRRDCLPSLTPAWATALPPPPCTGARLAPVAMAVAALPRPAGTLAPRAAAQRRLRRRAGRRWPRSRRGRETAGQCSVLYVRFLAGMPCFGM